MSDRVILLCDGKKFTTSKTLLSSASPYFDVMFKSHFRESVSGKVNLEGVTSDALEIILDFILEGNIPDTIPDLYHWIQVLQASHLLQIEELTQRCLLKISGGVSLENCFELWQLANLYDFVGLAAKVSTLVAKNFDEAVESLDFSNLSIDQLEEVLQHPELKASSRQVVVEAVNSWAAFQGDTRKQYLTNFGKLVTLGGRTYEKSQILLSQMDTNCENTERCLPCSEHTINRKFPKLLCFIEDKEGCIMFTLDLDKIKWSRGQKLSLRLESGMSLVYYGDCVYFIGGGVAGPCIRLSDVVYSYNVTNNIVCGTGKLIIPVGYAGVGTLNGWIYIVNGLSMEKRGVRVVQRYQASTNTCYEIESTNEGHVRPFVFSYTDCLYVLGSKTNAERSVEQFNSITDQWTTVSGIPGSINWCRVAGLGSKVYVVRRITDKVIHEYDLSSGSWTDVGFQNGPSHIFAMWSLPSSEQGLPGSLLCRTESGMVFLYKSDTATWQEISDDEPDVENCRWWQSVLVF